MAFFSLSNELIQETYIAYFDRDAHCLVENGPWFHVLFHYFIVALHMFLDLQAFCCMQTMLLISYSSFTV